MYEELVLAVAILLSASARAGDETQFWQDRIDAAGRAGGGCVTIPAGRHQVGQLDLRSNVELHLDEGAVLEGLPGLEHYRVTELPYSEGTWSAVVFGLNVTNVAITGKGEIFGNGTAWPQPSVTYPVGQEGLRARGLFFADSRNIRLEDFTLRDAACWGIVFKCCDGVSARRVKIDSHANVNNDGFDVEAKNVLIEDCDVDSGDDAFCVKSNNPDFVVENVTFRNCVGRSHCNVCKIGTATRGTVRDVRYENIRCEPPRRDFIDTRKDSKGLGGKFFFRPGHPEFPNGVGLSMAAIENVDGGRVENITVDGLSGSGYKVPLFVRGGNRPTLNRLPHGNQYVFRGIAIRNVKAEGLDPTANSISGVGKMPVRDVTLEDVDIVCCGAGVEASERAMVMEVPDVSKRYPECMMFQPSILPAYGLYADYVDGLKLSNVRFRIKEGTRDVRPPTCFTKRVAEHADPLGGPLLNLVDPLIGTEGAGSQYGGMQPYTCVPFGSFHAVPMTRTNRIGRLSFNSSDDTLLGIILTRQPAIWMGDWGEVRVEVPPAKIGKLDAKPYLTRVTAGGHTYEYTATAHAAWIRGLDAATVAAFPESGTNTNRMDAKYGYPLPNFGGRWYADKSHHGELKIGLSLISVEQAKANLANEIGTRTFGEIVAGVKAQWEEMFSRIVIEASDDEKTIFYTGLYHTLLYPRQMDEDGRYYSAFDDKIHAGTRYNCFSLWDTYRAEHPWLTLIAPERVDGMMQSLVDMYKEGGWLPKWPNPSYTGIMVGAPAEVVLREAIAKGFKGFDWATAHEAIRKNATVPQVHDTKRRWEDRGMFGRAPETRAGLTSYLKRGYVACDETAESVSRTQDFSLADRNRNYTNLWCAAEGLFLPRRADGSFVSRKELKPPYHDYCEQQPETGVWAVPHDPEGLAELMGGNAEAIRRLDEFFDTIFFKPDGRGNGSIHGNETSHHCAYLYNRFGAPEKTQQRVRQILTRCYSTNRKGFDGNEDCGQMSAWYIFSALGFYPLDPVSGEHEIGSPLVKAATLQIATATLRIVVKGYSPARWRVKRIMFNGRELINWRVRHSDLAAGGELCFEMSDSCESMRKDASI